MGNLKPMALTILLQVATLIWCLATKPTTLVAAKARHFKWEVGYTLWSPDCEERVVMGINGQFPGPTIRARAGDTIHVELTNRLTTEGVVIHWHGMKQLGIPWADGTASISQRPIRPGESFTYSFLLDKAGTYFYHGHYGMQRSVGLYGSLIVDVAEGEVEPFHYDDGEFNKLLSDSEVGLSSKPFRWIGEPQFTDGGKVVDGSSIVATELELPLLQPQQLASSLDVGLKKHGLRELRAVSAGEDNGRRLSRVSTLPGHSRGDGH